MFSGYRAITALLPQPIYVIPNRQMGRVLAVLWALAAICFVAWYAADQKPAPTP